MLGFFLEQIICDNLGFQKYFSIQTNTFFIKNTYACELIDRPEIPNAYIFCMHLF